MNEFSDQKAGENKGSSSPVYLALFGIVTIGAFMSALSCIAQLGEWLMLWLKADISVLKLYFPVSELLCYIILLLMLLRILRLYRKPVRISSTATIISLIVWIFSSLGYYALSMIGPMLWTSLYGMYEFREIQIWKSGSLSVFHLLYVITLAICLVYAMAKDREYNS